MKKKITVRDVIKKNLSKHSFPFVEVLFGCMEIDLHLVRDEDGDIALFSSEFGREILEKILNEKVEKFEYYPNEGVPRGYDTSRLSIVVKRAENEFVKI